MRATGWASLFAALAVAGLSTIASAAETSSEAALRHGRGLAELFATGAEPAAALRFVEQHYAASALAEKPADARAKTFARVASDLGTAAVVTVEPLGERGARVVLKAERQALWVLFEIEVEPGPPFGVLGTRIQAEDSPPETVAATEPLTREQALTAIRARIDALAAEDQFSGVVLVAKDGAPLIQQVVGFADRGLQVPNRVDTKFNLGSINKRFTELAIHQLAEAGKLSLDDTLAHLWPDYPNAEVARRVTIAQLLDHTSGMGDLFGARYDATPRDKLRGLSDYLPLFVDQPLSFEPGADRRYSNAGFVVLGLLIERLSGESYYDYVREHIYRPAGMNDSGHFASDEVVPNRARGYARMDERLMQAEAGEAGRDLARRENGLSLPGRGSSAGGGYSTAPDLLRFAQALEAGKLGGTEVSRSRGGLATAGGAKGLNAALEDDWASGWTVIVLANLDPPAAERLAGEIRQILKRVPGGG